MYARGEGKLWCRRRPTAGRSGGHMLLQKFLNLKSRKCHFQRFLQDIFSRFILRKSKLLTLVLLVTYSVYGKKRPVTSSELWKNKRIKNILTQGFGSGENCIIHSDLIIKKMLFQEIKIYLYYTKSFHMR